jgi:putative NADH-flavin reductase
VKLVVFGSTGSTGRQIVQRALADGHEVTAFARKPESFDLEHPKLKVVQGDALDVAAVERAVRGQDAVVSALGTPASTRTKVRSEGTGNIVRAMERAGVRRLISLSSLGIGDSRPMLPLVYRFFLVPFFLRQGFAEHELQEQRIRRSDTDWTIVRPGAYTNGGLTQAYRHGLAGKDHEIKAKVSRADVADFVVSQLVETLYLRKAPWLSY